MAAVAEPPPPVTSAQWRVWYEELLASRLAACPRERSVSYHFSSDGDDETGDGTPEHPFRTIAKARSLLESAPPTGDVAILFRRGDVWRENEGIITALPNVTLADYGRAEDPRPLLTVFVSVGDPAAWEPVEGRVNVYRRPAPGVVTWAKEDDDFDHPYSRQASAAGVEANEASWWWDTSGMLYVHPKHDVSGMATDPRTDGKAYESVGPSDAGLVVRGDGSRIENIRAVGWGLRENTPSQQHGIESRARGTDRVAIVRCDSYYGSSHAMVHAASGSRGGIATFVECRAGLTRFNGVAGETVFNTFSYQGGQETIFDQCVATHGTLPSSDWDSGSRRRGRSFYGHTGGGADHDFGLLVVNECSTLDRPFGCESPAAANNLPAAAELSQVRGFIVGEFFEGGPGTGPNFGIASRGSVRLNGRYLRLTPPPGYALANYAQDGWVINSEFEVDVSSQQGRFALFNASPTTSNLVRLWHCFFRVIAPSGSGGAGVRMLLDYDVPSRSEGSSLVNCVLSNESLATFEPNLGPATGGTVLRANAYYRVRDGSFSEDQTPVVLEAPPALDVTPACDAPLACRAGPLPGAVALECDSRGWTGRRIAIGPLEPRPCGDFNGDWSADFFDYLDMVAALEAEDPSADVNGDGVVDFFDYLYFVAMLDASC
jgi:hypothetical protein